MTTLKQILLVVAMIFIVALFTGCGQATSVSTATVGNTLTLTPALLTATMVFPSLTPTPSSLPTCTPLPILYIYVIDEAVYHSDAGIELGAWGAIGILQQALEEHHPEWAQESGLAEYVWDSSATQMIGVNPRVFLVTAGVSLDWRVPENSDLFEAISRVGVTLTQHYREFRFNEDLQANYPQIANAESYALFAFFGYDLEKLDPWQQEYDRMFGEVQPRIAAEGCFPSKIEYQVSPIQKPNMSP